MKLSDIVTMASTYVQNNATETEYANWLTTINQHFFEVVKIPQIAYFNAVKDVAEYTLPVGIALRNIDRVVVGTAQYGSLQLADVPPGQNGWTFDEVTNKLTLSPAPSYNAQGYVRYAQKATASYTGADLTVSPEAPEAYHHLYAYGLAELMAMTLDDMVKAQNYGQQYRSQLSIAQANYQRGG